MLLRSWVNKINEDFKGLMPGLKAYGLTQAIDRTRGTEREILPGEVGKDGEIIYVGIDDDPAIVYHRNSAILTTRSAKQGVGDGYSDVVNTYQMAMIVFNDATKTKLFPEELFLFLQANMPDAIKSDPYKNIVIRTTNVILNSQLVFAAEYDGAAFKLPAEKSLFQINYTIESTFKKDCFVKCPDNC